jgi:hypothetical protein
MQWAQSVVKVSYLDMEIRDEITIVDLEITLCTPTITVVTI